MDERISNLLQVNYIKRYTLDNGIKVIELYNGVLRVLLNESRNLDIMQVFYKGINTSYISKCGFGNDLSTQFNERYEGGTLYTCGLETIGDREGLPIHGTIHNHISQIEKTYFDDKRIEVVGFTRSSAIFAHNLVLKRTISMNLNEGYFILNDELINEGYKDENYAILYHINSGYPLLDDNAKIIGDFKSVRPRTTYAKENFDKYNLIEKPIDNREEMCYYIDNNSNYVSLFNEKMNLKFTIEYSTDTLPHLLEWKSMASTDYALGLEPTTTFLDDEFKYKIIKPKEMINFKIKFKYE